MSWVAHSIPALAFPATKMRWFVSIAGTVLLAAAFLGAAIAATPAGTVIRNQASATYLDTDGSRVTVTSNVVQTTVEQVAGVQLVQDQTVNSLNNASVSLSHRIKNTGNGNDRFDIQLVNLSGDDYDLIGLTLFADEDQNGVADSNTPITQSLWLAPDEEFYFVLNANVPSSVSAGDNAQLLVTVASTFNSSVAGTNTDSVLIVDGANVSVVKTIEGRVGLSPSGNYVVNLEYANVGNQTAYDIVLVDALPAGMLYVDDSARWNNSSTVLTDANPTDVQSGSAGAITFCAYHSSCTGLPESSLDNDTSSVNQLTAVIDSLAPGVSGELSFEVSIAADLPGSNLYNTAEYSHDAPASQQPDQYSNSVAFIVLSSIGVVANGSVATSIDGMNEPVSVISAAQGTTVTFSNIIWNTGSNPDTFNIELDTAASTFPFGSFYRLLKSDAATPLLDTNGDGLLDTGPIPAGQYAEVVLSVVLPANSAGDNGGVGFSIPKTARSIQDSTVFNSIEDHLDEIIGNRVDLTNQAAAGSAGALGAGPGPELSPVSTVPVDATGIAEFDLFIRNQGQAVDQYQLSASLHLSGLPLADGWAIEFVNVQTGQALIDTGPLQSGESIHVLARLSVPTDVSPGSHSVYFKVQSQLSGTLDIKHDAVAFAPVSVLQFEPNLSAQLEPGGSVVYKHVVTNSGVVPINGIQFVTSQSQAGWSSVLYEDTDANQALSPGDQIISTALDLAAGESLDVFIKVFAPANASPAQRNVSTIVINWSGGDSVQVQDISAVSNSNVSIKKEQALDTACDGTPDTGSEFAVDILEIAPGNNCVVYRLTATNLGIEPSYNVTIHDYTPSYTLYRAPASCSRSPCWITEPANEQTGTINAETDQLLPGDSFSVQFSVRVK